MNVDKVVSIAQIALSVAYVAGYFLLLFMVIDGRIRTPVEWKDQVSVLMGVLTTGVTMILQFWFSRARATERPPSGQM